MRKLFCLFGLMVVSLYANEPNRTWTSADGRTIEARFIDEKKGKVRIRRTDGRVFNIPLDNLSEEDRKYVESLAVDKPSPSTDPKDNVEGIYSKPTGSDARKYGSKPNYFVKSALDLEMIWVEPGTFMMGSPESETGRYDNEIQHEVTLTKGFYLGKYEITQEQYEKVMGKNPSFFKGYKHPVETVSWVDAMEFCKVLTKMELQNNYGGDYYSHDKIQWVGWEFTLPTEAQWEYACRAGTKTAFSWGDTISSQQANYADSKLGKTVAVGSYYPNPWGFYDMHGNIYEICADWERVYPNQSVVDPRGPSIGSYHVIRGGSWGFAGIGLRSAYRNRNDPRNRNSIKGFRVAFQQVEQTSEGSEGSSMGEYPSGAK